MFTKKKLCIGSKSLFVFSINGWPNFYLLNLAFIEFMLTIVFLLQAKKFVAQLSLYLLMILICLPYTKVKLYYGSKVS